jgi:ribosome-associated toxin RatA of RatAB toxin-antitoxin module
MAFETVATEALLPGCIRKENAWNIISDFSRYPAIMENVDKVEVTERTSDSGISRWYVTVEEAPLYWVEKDFFNPRDYEIVFKSIDGDFDNINGRWRIKNDIASGITIFFEIQYNLGIPVIEEVLGTVLRDKMKTNIDKMVDAVRTELSAHARDERKLARQAIGRFHACTFNGTPLRLFVLNLSAGGMMTRFAPGLLDEGVLTIAGAALNVTVVYPDQAENNCRFVFEQPLDEALLKSLLSKLTVGSGRLRPSATGPHDALIFTSEREFPIHILEITPSGMSFSDAENPLPDLETFTIGNTAIPLKEVVRDAARNRTSVSFAEALDDDQYRRLREHFGAAKK